MDGAEARLTFLAGIVTLLGMEHKQSTITQTLPSGRRMTITLDRDEAKRALARGEIAVYDDRFTDNPSFRIYDSYRKGEMQPLRAQDWDVIEEKDLVVPGE